MEYERKFSERLAQLRLEKGVSARDMSLSIGQCPGYINNIENQKYLPSMSCFFYICEYLNITPQDFFNFEIKNPNALNALSDLLIKLSDNQIKHLTAIIKDLVEK